jgi:MOSC domain-containing protein YiiM
VNPRSGVDARERCDECRFDSAAYAHHDVMGTLQSIEVWWQLISAPEPAARIVARPGPTTWSALEYCAHTELVVGLHAAGLDLLAPGTDVVLPPFADDDVANRSPVEAGTTIETAIRGLAHNVAQLRDRYAVAHERGADATLVVGAGAPQTAAGLTRHALHDTLHHLQDVGRGFVALGGGAPRHTGRVAQVSAGPGGVPKVAVAHAEVGYRGIEGDRQAARRHHGRVWQALCLFSLETVERFRAEGHPITPGAAGENLTLAGVDFAALRPGTRLRVGEVLCELSLPALPCAKNARWFTDRDPMRLHHEREPGATRWYARVLEDGGVAPGMPVEVEPAG